jgi:hypothetical protein
MAVKIHKDFFKSLYEAGVCVDLLIDFGTHNLRVLVMCAIAENERA